MGPNGDRLELGLDTSEDSEESLNVKRIILSNRQRDFLTEITAISPTITELERMGCGFCDPRMRKLTSSTFRINEQLLSHQVKFLPPTDSKPGVFEFHRIFYKSYSQLSSFETESIAMALSISRKFNKFPLARKDIDYKLALDF